MPPYSFDPLKKYKEKVISFNWITATETVVIYYQKMQLWTQNEPYYIVKVNVWYQLMPEKMVWP